MAYSRPCTVKKAPSAAFSNLRIERSPDINWRDTRTAAQCLSHLCLSEQLSDITFTFSAYRDVKLPAHKFVLSMRSAVFEAMFFGSLSEGGKTVTIEDIEPEVMKTVLKFVYDDEPTINGDNVLPCLYTAKKYNLSGLVIQCSEFLENNIDVSNVCQVHEHAVFYEMKPLQERCLAFIVENATSVFSSPGFLSLSQVTLLNVLKSEELVSDEIDVFTAAIRWAEHKCEVNKKSKIGENMRSQLEEAVFQIRFPIIPIEKFAQVVAPSGILTKEELLILYQYNATKGTSPIGTFRHENRSGATLTIDLRKHVNSKQYRRANNNGSSLQVEYISHGDRCNDYDYESYDEEESFCEDDIHDIRVSNDNGLTFKITKAPLKLKSITGMFVRNVKRITNNGKNVTGYKFMENKILFEPPIEMKDRKIVQFIPEKKRRNYTADLEELPLFSKSRQSKSVDINQYKCTITQIPAETETITFLK
ncbi:BTB/POZ domain-containing protein 2-like isoform X2 [Ruditapes philippinarum]|uniref:BTB/POZ domain-containing protein 2-like isoform X2 n=1 Tax=Ruditapes philippinarum TaxID=129788 RepID=UPI00295C1D3A|nr:BTB/POZ domain-containing protein 2-like isoform X2 [Ruditapes philippinarum]XP_060580189.1 BTB/POZ domain-containing protein 2-like isoform X2 [Ruditapes philippinarum]XP_060580190.1 BTB/POZ domain-containing protein 2-like isoform X2 [Ruditapes philippinarum]